LHEWPPPRQSKRAGVSAAEKKTRMLALLHETQDFFVLKELEKLASNSKGIVPQSVKEVLQELKDDRLIECEKIGTSNYFWSFPATAAVAKESALAAKAAELDLLGSTEKQLRADVQAALVGREPTVRRALNLRSPAHTLVPDGRQANESTTAPVFSPSSRLFSSRMRRSTSNSPRTAWLTRPHTRPSCVRSRSPGRRRASGPVRRCCPPLTFPYGGRPSLRSASNATENTLLVLQYIKAHTGLSDAEIREQLGICAWPKAR
jgi:hypothetical protein